MQGRTDGRAIAVLLVMIVGLACAAPAAAQMQPLKYRQSHLMKGNKSLLLFPRERVVLRVAPDGMLKILSATAADPGQALPKPGRSDDATAAIREAEPGTIAVLMGAIGDGDTTLLMIASGVSQALDYRAASLVEAGRPKLTPLKVCTVLPLLPNFEQWENEAAPVIMLTAFKAKASSEVVCPDPPPVGEAPKVLSK